MERRLDEDAGAVGALAHATLISQQFGYGMELLHVLGDGLEVRLPWCATEQTVRPAPRTVTDIVVTGRNSRAAGRRGTRSAIGPLAGVVIETGVRRVMASRRRNSAAPVERVRWRPLLIAGRREAHPSGAMIHFSGRSTVARSESI